MKEEIYFTFRWPVKQISEKEVVMVLQPGNTPLINPEWAKREKLTDDEVKGAEIEVIKHLAGPVKE